MKLDINYIVCILRNCEKKNSNDHSTKIMVYPGNVWSERFVARKLLDPFAKKRKHYLKKKV